MWWRYKNIWKHKLFFCYSLHIYKFFPFFYIRFIFYFIYFMLFDYLTFILMYEYTLDKKKNLFFVFVIWTFIEANNFLFLVYIILYLQFSFENYISMQHKKCNSCLTYFSSLFFNLSFCENISILFRIFHFYFYVLYIYLFDSTLKCLEIALKLK